MAKSRMYSLEYSTQFKKDFKKITKLPIADILEVGGMWIMHLRATGKALEIAMLSQILC